MSWLPGESTAHTAALATALLGAAAVVVLYAACRAWGARPLASWLAAAMFASAPVVLRLHTQAEVFALNNLVCALVLWLSATNGPLRGTRRVTALALVAGLGMANHLTCVLLAPIGLLGTVRGMREATDRSRAAASAIAALVVGLAPYAYLVFAPVSQMSWGDPQTLGDVVRFFTRADYGGPGAFSPVPGEVDAAANVMALFETLARGWLWLPAALGVGVLVYRAVRGGAGESRTAFALLVVSWLLAGPLLVLRFNIEPVGVGLYVCQRFYILPLLLLAIPVALSFTMIADRVTLRARLLERPITRAAIALVVFATLTATSLREHLAVGSRAVQAAVVNLLQSMPENAIAITSADHLHSGTIYAQSVLGLRRDVDVVTASMLTFPWYRARLIARGILPAPDDSELPIAQQLAEHALASRRQLLVDIFQQSVHGRYATYPHGMLFHVVPPGQSQLSLDQMIALNERLFAAFDLAYPKPGPHDGYPTAIHRGYAWTWIILGQALSRAGRHAEANKAYATAQALSPEGVTFGVSVTSSRRP